MCDNVPKLYGVKTPSLDKEWDKFGEGIKGDSLGHY